MKRTKVSKFYVQVNNWSRNRLVELRSKDVAMEVARINCSHCPTCSNRMDTVASRVHRAGLVVKWEQRGGGRMIVIPLPKNTDPVQHLSEVLELSIRRY